MMDNFQRQRVARHREHLKRMHALQREHRRLMRQIRRHRRVQLTASACLIIASFALLYVDALIWRADLRTHHPKPTPEEVRSEKCFDAWLDRAQRLREGFTVPRGEPAACQPLVTV